MSILDKLTEGIVSRDLQKEGAALLSKWESTGLLEGLEGDQTRNGMAALLENQAKELLREASTMSGGDVEGFASVAFPLVRRVFGGLIANDLVSVQPMSLPSGLIFFLDFTIRDPDQTDGGRLGYDDLESVFGGKKTGQSITGGINLGTAGADATAAGGFQSGFYGMNHGYSSPTGSTIITITIVASGTVGGVMGNGGTAAYRKLSSSLAQYDPDLSGSAFVAATVPLSSFSQLNKNALAAIDDTGSLHMQGDRSELDGVLVKRLTRLDPTETVGAETKVLLVYAHTASVETTGPGSPQALSESVAIGGITGISIARGLTYPQTDNFDGTADAADGSDVGIVAPTTTWGLENSPNIPEIDIKVDAVSVTAITKKLKAKWTPELGQDLNAYHNLDAEVELTSILSEHIALEIDREILNDLIVGATGGTLYWSRHPGKFVNREDGTEVGAASVAPDFTGTVSEWYETLAETINDVSARIHRKTLRGGANFVVVSPEVANVLEFTSGFRASVTHDDDRGTIGAIKTGNLSKKWDVYVDPYFPRNLILVGRRGGSFLESGFVYAPYVPLQVTPTIFGTEDFVPRKGVMTRYAKKMVRPDMYGLVIVEDLV